MNKKQTVKRLVLYLSLSFLPIFLISLFVDSFVVEDVFVSERKEIAYAIGMFGMLMPAIAHLLTRLFTKEGFSNVYLMPRVKEHFGVYLASVLVILGQSFVNALIIWRMWLSEYSFGEVFSNEKGIAMLLFSIASAIIMFFPAFGEEWGWRGYMMPKLTELFGTPLAVIIGGVLWGLWHAPLTVNGHNFGVDYPGFPYLGIVYMCIFCTTMNAFLTLLTEKSKSIYPASFAHMMNNNVSAFTIMSCFFNEDILKQVDSMNLMDRYSTAMPLVSLVIGIVSFILLCKMKSSKSQVCQDVEIENFELIGR